MRVPLPSLPYIVRQCRTKWTWPSWQVLLGKEKASEEQSMEKVAESAIHSPLEQLRAIATRHLGRMGGDTWKGASLGNANRKGKILCEYEMAFSMSIPNQDLGTITTFGDLLEILESYQPPEESPSVYPLFQDEVLPPNLSVQFINTAPLPRKIRRPFQNTGVVRNYERIRKKTRARYNKPVGAEPGRREKVRLQESGKS